MKRCPVCGKPMREIRVKTASGDLILNVCVTCVGKDGH